MGIDLAEVIERLDPDGMIRAGHKQAGAAQPAAPAVSPRPDQLAKRVRAYIAATPGAVAGQGGHNRTFELAQVLVHGFELPPSEALGLLLSDFNPKCEPPWSLRELEHKVDEAVKKPCDKPRGWMLADDRLASPAPAPASSAARPAVPPASVGQPAAKTTEGELNESDDDPHRIARSLLAGYQNRGRRTLIYWRGDFHEWSGVRYQTAEDKVFRATTNGATHRELAAQHRARLKSYDPAAGDEPPKMPKVTKVLAGNVTAAMESMCLVRAVESPAWLGEAGPDPRDLVATDRGLVHLPAYADGRADAVIENTPGYLNFNAVTFAVDPAAAEPRDWLAFLAGLWPDDAESIALLQEWFGYLLTPDTSQQKMLLLVGPPRSGKGTIARVLQELIGLDNCCNPTLGTLGTPFGLSSLVGKSLAVIEDARLGHKTDAGLVSERLLTISGEGRIDVDRKHRDIITAKLNARFVVATNELPRLSDASGALARRWCLLHLTKSFLGREDLTLADRLRAELPGIFNWAVAGWKRLRSQGRFTLPTSMADLTDEITAVSSPVGEFVSERCQVGSAYSIEVEELFQEWKSWCDRKGRKEAGTDARFGVELRSCIPTLKKSRRRTAEGQVNVYRGVRIASLWDESGDELTGAHSAHSEQTLHAKETSEGVYTRKENTMDAHHERCERGTIFGEGEL